MDGADDAVVEPTVELVYPPRRQLGGRLRLVVAPARVSSRRQGLLALAVLHFAPRIEVQSSLIATITWSAVKVAPGCTSL